MANLGSDNTPISGELFGLPSGWTLTENTDGEAVFEDSGGNVVLRRDATNGEWVTDSINADTANLNDATVANSPTNNDDVVRKTETDAIQNDVDGKVEQTEFDNHSAQHENGGTDALDLTGLSGDLADQQQPTDHSHDGTADSGGASLNPEATTLQDTQEPTTDGEIRRSGSDVFVHTGGVSRNATEFLTASQVEILWTEDANSPHNLSTDGSTYTLANTYDQVLVVAQSHRVTADDTVNLTLNGLTDTRYRYDEEDGTTMSNEAAIELTNTARHLTGEILMTGRFPGHIGVSADLVFQSNMTARYGNYGSSTDSSGSLSSFDFGVTNDIDIEVYGRNIA